MGSNTLKLSIPKPCSERWENFDVTREGGYCKNCQKTVTDFTRKGDDEIFKYFSSNPAHACGKFRPDQLRAYRYRQPVHVKPGLRLLKAGLVSLFLILLDRQVLAQPRAMVPTEESIVVQSTEETQEVSVGSISFVVRGVVLSADDDSPVPGVLVLLKGTSEGTVTDLDGKFEFPSALNEGDVLIFSFIGFTTVEYTIHNKTIAPLEIAMKMVADVSFLGEVYVEGVYASPKHSGFFSKIGNLF